MQNLDDFEPSYGSLKKIKKSKNWFDIGFSRPLCFWLFSQPKLVQTFNVGGVSESSGPSLDDGHRDFENQCRNAGEN